MQIKFPTEIKKIVSIAKVWFPLDIVLMLATAALVASVRYIAVVCSLNIFLHFYCFAFFSIASYLFHVSEAQLFQAMRSLIFFSFISFLVILTPLPEAVASFWLLRPNFCSDWTSKFISFYYILRRSFQLLVLLTMGNTLYWKNQNTKVIFSSQTEPIHSMQLPILIHIYELISLVNIAKSCLWSFTECSN